MCNFIYLFHLFFFLSMALSDYFLINEFEPPSGIFRLSLCRNELIRMVLLDPFGMIIAIILYSFQQWKKLLTERHKSAISFLNDPPKPINWFFFSINIFIYSGLGNNFENYINSFPLCDFLFSFVNLQVRNTSICSMNDWLYCTKNNMILLNSPCPCTIIHVCGNIF